MEARDVRFEEGRVRRAQDANLNSDTLPNGGSDAVIDSEQTVNVNPGLLAQQEEDAEDEDGVAPLPQYRTLRRRGLSDSSIHSTFTNHGEEGLPLLRDERR